MNRRPVDRNSRAYKLGQLVGLYIGILSAVVLVLALIVAMMIVATVAFGPGL